MIQRVSDWWNAGIYDICEWVCEEHNEKVNLIKFQPK